MEAYAEKWFMSYLLHSLDPSLDSQPGTSTLYARRFPTPAAPHAPMNPNEMGMAIRSFLSPMCPVCETAKTVDEDPFCENCLALLTPALLEAVTDRSTYLDAFGQSFRSIMQNRAAAGWVLRDKSVAD